MTMPRVALTFDDGPASWTDAILDELAAHDARATFFVIGAAAECSTEALRRIAAAGHEIGNHTWSHPMLARDCDDDTVRDELERTNMLLADVVGSPPRRFRAPRHDVDERVEAIARDLGLVHTSSDVRPPDWDPRCSAAFIATFVLRQVAEGTVVGLHDGVAPNERRPGASRQPTVTAVSTIVPRLRERGFELVTAGDLLDAGSRA